LKIRPSEAREKKGASSAGGAKGGVINLDYANGGKGTEGEGGRRGGDGKGS